jgi:transposase
MYTLIATAKLNRVDLQAWPQDVLARIADHKNDDLAALLRWIWQRPSPIDTAA